VVLIIAFALWRLIRYMRLGPAKRCPQTLGAAGVFFFPFARSAGSRCRQHFEQAAGPEAGGES
jgi:hypothetical protein